MLSVASTTLRRNTLHTNKAQHSQKERLGTTVEMESQVGRCQHHRLVKESRVRRCLYQSRETVSAHHRVERDGLFTIVERNGLVTTVKKDDLGTTEKRGSVEWDGLGMKDSSGSK